MFASSDQRRALLSLPVTMNALRKWTVPLLFAGMTLTAAATVIRVPQEVPTIQAGLDILENGDTVLVALGEYAEALIAPPKSFTLKGDVTPDTGNYPRPVIDPSPLPNSDSLGCLLLPQDSQPVLEDLIFRNGAEMYPHQGTGGVQCFRCSGVTFRRCVFDSTYRAFTHDPRPQFQGFVDTLSSCVFRDLQLAGVTVLDYTVIARDCDFVSGQAFSLCHASGPAGSSFVSCRFGSNPIGYGLILEGHNVEVSNCVFGPSAGSTCLLKVNSTSAVVRSNIFTGNDVTNAACWTRGTAVNALLIENNVFVDNVAGWSGTSLRAENTSQSDTIRGNVFMNCFSQGNGANAIILGPGFALESNRFVESGMDTHSDPAIRVTNGIGSTLRGNLFLNTGLALQSSVNAVDAEWNWWGDSTGPYHGGLNPAGLGDTIVGNVDFEPWYGDTSFVNSIRGITAPLPDHFTLDAFPNPFNTTVTLKLIPSAVAIVRVELFDILGRKVQEIWSGPLAYEKTISFDGSHLASGIYFVRVWQPIGNRPLALTKLVLLK